MDKQGGTGTLLRWDDVNPENRQREGQISRIENEPELVNEDPEASRESNDKPKDEIDQNPLPGDHEN
jgi:hypothetical protein